MSELKQTHGTFCWNELLTNDVPADKAFYGELFGWSLVDSSDDGMDYTMINVADNSVGGIMETPAATAEMQPAWGGYVTVDDIDATVAKAQKLGGNIILAPKEIENTGRIAVIQDPQGAMLSVITPLQ